MTSKIYLQILFAGCFSNIVREVDCADQNQIEGLLNEPLFLTPYLEVGKIKEAQQKSKVSPDICGVKSYTGFLTVDNVCENNLFFWFVPAEINWEEAAVLLWLSGGPGTSSLLGLFAEVGPFLYVNESKRLVKNKNRWTKEFNVIFLDQPVGSGFSFTKKGCYMTNLTNIAREVHSAVKQFFILFPTLQRNNFFLTGDSYSGTYQPAVGVEIDKKNRDAKVKINFKGIIIGNPYMDLRCHNYATYWFEAGLIEDYHRDTILKYQEIRNNYVSENNSTGATEYENKIWDGVFETIILPSRYNILYDKELTLDFKYFVNSTQIRQKIKVGNIRYNATSYFGVVGYLLREEMIVPATQNVKTLLDKKYLVGFYTGQLDLDCSYSSLVCVLGQLNHLEYQKAKRRGWHVNGRLAGWVRQGGNLVSMVIRDAGHLAPRDRGEVTLAMVKGLIGSYPANKLNLTEEKQPF